MSLRNTLFTIVSANEATGWHDISTVSPLKVLSGANEGGPGLEITGNLDISGNTDIDGTLEADAITVDGSTLASVIAGTVVTSSTNAVHVSVADNESSNENDLIPFIEDQSATGNVGLESDGDFHYNPNTGTVTATIFKGNIDAVDGDFDGTLEADAITVNGSTLASVIAGTTVANATDATNAVHVSVADNESTNESDLIPFIEDASATGNVGLESDGDFHYNPSTGTVTATIFKGNIDAVDGDFDGTLEADAITVNGSTLASVIAGTTVANATLAATVTVADTTDTTCFVGLFESVTGSLAAKTDTGLTYNAGTGVITATGFAGPLTGNVTGDASGSSGSCTGNAATATILETTRAIGGVNFNGSAAIDLPGVNASGNQDTSGNAATATALATARAFTTTGDVVVASTNFDGSANFTAAATIQADAVETAMLNPNIISGQTEVTSVDADYLLVWDATDSELKKVDAGEFRGGGGGEENQNAWTTIDINDTDSGFAWGTGNVVADTKTDTLKLIAGTNITLESDPATGKDAIRITASGSGGGHDIIDESGSALTTQTKLTFIGELVEATNNGGDSSTDITVDAKTSWLYG